MKSHSLPDNPVQSLVDVSGKTVSKHALNGKITIPTDGLQKGLYLLKITGDKKNTVIKKIVVQ